jgi:2-hydroxychromene-2-carboxylate isomerase
VATLEFHFDFISPYAYLAWTQIHALAERYAAAVVPKPLLFAALLDANATKGPAEIPSKRLWVFKDTFRRARYLGVPFAPPPAHPFHPLLALRLASCELDGADPRRVIDVLFAATWGGGPGVTDEAVVERLLRDAGLPAQALLAEARSPAAKAKLRGATDEALARGVFGVPTLFVDGELFWGLDAFDHVARRLEGRDVLVEAEVERWRDLPVAAQRSPR